MIGFSLVLAMLPSLLSPDLELIEASLNGDRAAAETAIASGAKLETRYSTRALTPLMLAIYRDHPELVQLLLTRGADANARNGSGQTPLIMAAAGGQLEIVSLLLARGAELDAADEIGNSALMWAAFWGHQEVAAALLEAGASPERRNQEDNTALLLAALSGASQRTRQLVAARRHAPSGRILPLVFHDREQTELLGLLLQYQADANARNRLGQSALMLLAGQGKRLPVQTLLKAGADPALQDSQGLTAADYARRAGFTQLAKTLENR